MTDPNWSQLDDHAKALRPHPIKKILNLAILVVFCLIVAMVVISWVPALQNNIVAFWLVKITDPILWPIRQVVPTFGGLDISPLLLVFGLQFIQSRFLR